MTKHFLILCLLLAITFLSEAQSTGGHCQTPDHRYGACVPIQNCKILFRIVTKRVLFQEDINFLKQSKCSDNETDVCCPSEAEATSTQRSTRERQTGARSPMPATNRISVRKCTEYADFAYNKTFVADVHTDVPLVSRVSNCGFTSQGLINGGDEAKRREFPHMALIGFRYNGETHWDCGGTLISEQFVLSAEHCSYSNVTGAALYVRLGEHDLSRTDDANHIDFNIIATIFHENVPKGTYNDIVLFKLDREVEFNYAIRPACLPEQLAVPRNVSASGWGRIEWRGRRSDVLLKVDLTTFLPTERRQTRFDRIYGTESIVYAGHLTESKDTCQGDSGGPLQVLVENLHCTYVVLGVTSRGPVCGSVGEPAIYTGVYSHLNWIEETVWPNE